MSSTPALVPDRKASRTRRALRRSITVGAVAVLVAAATAATAVAVHAQSGTPQATARAEDSIVDLAEVLPPDAASQAVAAADQAAAAKAAADQAAAAKSAADQAAAAKAADQAAAAKAAAGQAAAAKAAADQAAAQPAAAPHAPAASSGIRDVWSTRIVNSGGQAAIDQCLGGLTRMSYSIQGKPYLTIHRGCGGAPVLSLRIGDHIAIGGAQYAVTDARDAAKGAPVSVLYGMHGTTILQTCYPTGGLVRAVAVTPVG